MRALSFLLTAGLLSSLGCLPLFANGGGYTKGLASTGAFKPFGIEQVQMLSERLEIDLHIEHAEVRIEYVLHNPGPKVTVEAGFPVAVLREYFLPSEMTSSTPVRFGLQDFALAADDEAVPTTVVEDELKLSGTSKPANPLREQVVKGWHVFKLDFGKGQTRRVSVRYRNPYACRFTHMSETSSVSPLSLSYLFSSAAAWSGAIKQGSVEVRAVSANPDRVEFSHPKRFQREGNSWKWLFADLEPTLEDDIAIVTRHSFYSPGNVEIGDEEKGSVWYVEWRAKDAKASANWELFRQDYQVSASSTKAPEGSYEYGAKLVGDRRQQSAWVEGAKGDGIGESLTVTLPKPAKVRRVGLVNGYAHTAEQYAANNRVARFEVRVNDENPFQIEVPDERLENEYFWFDLPSSSEPVKSVKLTILGVHKGTQFEDTCISEVVLAVPLSKGPKLLPVR